jgi:hypothetical protein
MSPRTRPDPTPSYLCGEPIGAVQASLNHVPPKRLFPSSMRSTLREPLVTLKTHPDCHKPWGWDEEYFFNSLLPGALPDQWDRTSPPTSERP